MDHVVIFVLPKKQKWGHLPQLPTTMTTNQLRCITTCTTRTTTQTSEQEEGGPNDASLSFGPKSKLLTLVYFLSFTNRFFF
jgi:hypothetical protein